MSQQSQSWYNENPFPVNDTNDGFSTFGDDDDLVNAYGDLPSPESSQQHQTPPSPYRSTTSIPSLLVPREDVSSGGNTFTEDIPIDRFGPSEFRIHPSPPSITSTTTLRRRATDTKILPFHEISAHLPSTLNIMNGVKEKLSVHLFVSPSNPITMSLYEVSGQRCCVQKACAMVLAGTFTAFLGTGAQVAISKYYKEYLIRLLSASDGDLKTFDNQYGPELRRLITNTLLSTLDALQQLLVICQERSAANTNNLFGKTNEYVITFAYIVFLKEAHKWQHLLESIIQSGALRIETTLSLPISLEPQTDAESYNIRNFYIFSDYVRNTLLSGAWFCATMAPFYESGNAGGGGIFKTTESRRPSFFGDDIELTEHLEASFFKEADKGNLYSLEAFNQLLTKAFAFSAYQSISISDITSRWAATWDEVMSVSARNYSEFSQLYFLNLWPTVIEPLIIQRMIQCFDRLKSLLGCDLTIYNRLSGRFVNSLFYPSGLNNDDIESHAHTCLLFQSITKSIFAVQIDHTQTSSRPYGSSEPYMSVTVKCYSLPELEGLIISTPNGDGDDDDTSSPPPALMRLPTPLYEVTIATRVILETGQIVYDILKYTQHYKQGELSKIPLVSPGNVAPLNPLYSSHTQMLKEAYVDFDQDLTNTSEDIGSQDGYQMGYTGGLSLVIAALMVAGGSSVQIHHDNPSVSLLNVEVTGNLSLWADASEHVRGFPIPLDSNLYFSPPSDDQVPFYFPNMSHLYPSSDAQSDIESIVDLPLEYLGAGQFGLVFRKNLPIRSVQPIRNWTRALHYQCEMYKRWYSIDGASPADPAYFSITSASLGLTFRHVIMSLITEERIWRRGSQYLHDPELLVLARQRGMCEVESAFYENLSLSCNYRTEMQSIKRDEAIAISSKTESMIQKAVSSHYLQYMMLNNKGNAFTQSGGQYSNGWKTPLKPEKEVNVVGGTPISDSQVEGFYAKFSHVDLYGLLKDICTAPRQRQPPEVTIISQPTPVIIIYDKFRKIFAKLKEQLAMDEARQATNAITRAERKAAKEAEKATEAASRFSFFGPATTTTKRKKKNPTNTTTTTTTLPVPDVDPVTAFINKTSDDLFGEASINSEFPGATRYQNSLAFPIIGRTIRYYPEAVIEKPGLLPKMYNILVTAFGIDGIADGTDEAKIDVMYTQPSFWIGGISTLEWAWLDLNVVSPYLLYCGSIINRLVGGVGLDATPSTTTPINLPLVNTVTDLRSGHAEYFPPKGLYQMAIDAIGVNDPHSERMVWQRRLLLVKAYTNELDNLSAHIWNEIVDNFKRYEEKGHLKRFIPTLTLEESAEPFYKKFTSARYPFKAVFTFVKLLNSFRAFLVERSLEARNAAKLGKYVSGIIAEPPKLYDTFSGVMSRIFSEPLCGGLLYRKLFRLETTKIDSVFGMNHLSDNAYGRYSPAPSIRAACKLNSFYSKQFKRNVDTGEFGFWLSWNAYQTNIDQELKGFGMLPKLPDDESGLPLPTPLAFLADLQQEMLEILHIMHLELWNSTTYNEDKKKKKGKDGGGGDAATTRRSTAYIVNTVWKDTILKRIKDPNGLLYTNYLQCSKAVEKYKSLADSNSPPLSTKDTLRNCSSSQDNGESSGGNLEPIEWIYITLWETALHTHNVNATTSANPTHPPKLEADAAGNTRLSSNFLVEMDFPSKAQFSAYRHKTMVDQPTDKILLENLALSSLTKTGKKKKGTPGFTITKALSVVRYLLKWQMHTHSKRKNSDPLGWNLFSCAFFTLQLAVNMVCDFYEHESMLGRCNVETSSKPVITATVMMHGDVTKAIGSICNTELPTTINASLFITEGKRIQPDSNTTRNAKSIAGDVSDYAISRQFRAENINFDRISQVPKEFSNLLQNTRIYPQYLTYSEKNKLGFLAARISNLNRDLPPSYDVKENVFNELDNIYTIGSYNVDANYAHTLPQYHQWENATKKSNELPTPLGFGNKAVFVFNNVQKHADKGYGLRILGSPSHFTESTYLKDQELNVRFVNVAAYYSKLTVRQVTVDAFTSSESLAIPSSFPRILMNLNSPKTPTGMVLLEYDPISSKCYYASSEDQSPMICNPAYKFSEFWNDTEYWFSTVIDSMKLIAEEQRVLGGSITTRNKRGALGEFWFDLYKFNSILDMLKPNRGNDDVDMESATTFSQQPLIKRIKILILSSYQKRSSAQEELRTKQGLTQANELIIREDVENARDLVNRKNPVVNEKGDTVAQGSDKEGGGGTNTGVSNKRKKGETKRIVSNQFSKAIELDQESGVAQFLAKMHTFWLIQKEYGKEFGKEVSSKMAYYAERHSIPTVIECRSRSLSTIAPYNISPLYWTPPLSTKTVDPTLLTKQEDEMTSRTDYFGSLLATTSIRFYDSPAVPAPKCEPHRTFLDAMQALGALVSLSNSVWSVCPKDGNPLSPLQMARTSRALSPMNYLKLMQLEKVCDFLLTRYPQNGKWCNLLEKNVYTKSLNEDGGSGGDDLIYAVDQYVIRDFDPVSGVMLDVTLDIPRQYMDVRVEAQTEQQQQYATRRATAATTAAAAQLKSITNRIPWDALKYTTKVVNPHNKKKSVLISQLEPRVSGLLSGIPDEFQVDRVYAAPIVTENDGIYAPFTSFESHTIRVSEDPNNQSDIVTTDEAVLPEPRNLSELKERTARVFNWGVPQYAEYWKTDFPTISATTSILDYEREGTKRANTSTKSIGVNKNPSIPSKKRYSTKKQKRQNVTTTTTVPTLNKANDEDSLLVDSEEERRDRLWAEEGGEEQEEAKEQPKKEYEGLAGQSADNPIDLLDDDDEEEEEEEVLFTTDKPKGGSLTTTTTTTNKQTSVQRKVLVLDMDETLLHTFPSKITESGRRVKYDFKVKATIKGKPYVGYVVFRPQVLRFLREMAKHYEIVVFTAGERAYASPVLDKLDEGRGFIKHRLYVDSCTEIEDHKGIRINTKELSLLGLDMKRTLIIDNSEVAFIYNPDNAILSNTWVGDETDDQLMSKFVPILLHLAKTEVVNIPVALQSLRRVGTILPRTGLDRQYFKKVKRTGPPVKHLNVEHYFTNTSTTTPQKLIDLLDDEDDSIGSKWARWSKNYH